MSDNGGGNKAPTVKSGLISSFLQRNDRKRPQRAIDDSNVPEGRTLYINKVPVRLPAKIEPYKTQQLMMVRIIQALDAKQSVMLESPTGSGKTLGLLASTCEWLLKYKKERAETNAKCPVHGSGATVPFLGKPVSPSVSEHTAAVSCPIVAGDSLEGSKYAAELDEDILPAKPAPPKPAQQPSTSAPKCICKDFVRVYYGTRTHKQIGQVVREFARLPASKQLKHSILASRDQLCINENARRTPDVTAACKALLAPGGTDCACRAAMRNGRLDYPKPVRTLLDQQRAPRVWDIEALVDALDNASPRICPYFAATRVCSQDADIIFAPFSYLMDPVVRDSTNVALKNAVVVLDEAHNVEGVCRDASSFDFHEKDVREAVRAVDVKLQAVPDMLSRPSVMGTGQGKDEIETYVKALRSYHMFLRQLEELLRAEALRTSEHRDDPTVPNSMRNRFTQNETFPARITESLKLKQVLQSANLLLDDDQHFKQATSNLAIVANRKVDPESGGTGSRDQQSPTAHLIATLVPSAEAIDVGERWLRFARFFRDTDNYANYKMYAQLERTDGMSEGGTQFGGGGGGYQRNRGDRQRRSGGADFVNTDLLGTDPRGSDESQDGGGWLCSLSGAEGGAVNAHDLKLSLWCMMPSIAFMDAFKETRSVILASGTLQPWATLSSELGLEFRYKVEGDQVISPDRVLASILHVGPTGHTLNAGYAATKTQEKMRLFCAELTRILRVVCDDVPGGVLCFLPSYRMMSDLQRFIENDKRALGTHKTVLFEPRRSVDLAETVRKFEQAVKAPKNREITGALLLAVHRGKVSEGIDFTDELARCVVSVGIPYPSAVDPQVEHKRRFNDALSRSQTGILNGGDWYATQAFRALNQSLGRCLRHAGDWGALVLVDERLAGPRERGSLSKWIRDRVQEYRQFDAFRTQLQQFVTKWTTTTTTTEQA